MKHKLNGTHIRALCTDIDGTLLDSRRELSSQTIDAIGKIKESIPVILASSRMPSAMRHLQRDLGILEHPLICYNGGYVLKYDAQGEVKILNSTTIPIDICEAILTSARGSSLHISLYVNDMWYAPRVDEWTIREATITKVSPVIKSANEVLQEWKQSNTGAHKVMCMGEASEISALESYLREKFQREIHVYHSKSTYLEIAPSIISKGTALKSLLDRLYKIDLEDVIAFGDNYNDIALLQAVGLGIAVENARPEVKTVAKRITGRSNHHGVAQAINQYLLNKDVCLDPSC